MRANMPRTSDRHVNEKPFRIALNLRESAQSYPLDLQKIAFYFIQTPKQVTMIFEGDAQVRRIYMDVPHSADPKPSWYGESVGHYEGGDTLVIDTIGLNNKTFLNNYRTPHTEKLHVMERWKLLDSNTLELLFTVDDPDTFFKPWTAAFRFHRVQRSALPYEEVCAENNFQFEYHVPVAEKPDF